jgi:hypothetical protein
MKNSNDTIGNRTRDIPACRAVPQPIAPPRAPCMYVRTCVCTYVCIYPCIYVCIWIVTAKWLYVCSCKEQSMLLCLNPLNSVTSSDSDF